MPQTKPCQKFVSSHNYASPCFFKEQQLPIIYLFEVLGREIRLRYDKWYDFGRTLLRYKYTLLPSSRYTYYIPKIGISQELNFTRANWKGFFLTGFTLLRFQLQHGFFF